jgi:hypothetical protein
MPLPRSSHRWATAVTDWRATTRWPSVATPTGHDKSWVLAMLAAKQRLRVALVPPQAADLTRPAGVAGTMPGRDEGTGAAIEPRTNGEQASDLAGTITRRLQSFAQWWMRLNYLTHRNSDTPGNHRYDIHDRFDDYRRSGSRGPKEVPPCPQARAARYRPRLALYTVAERRSTGE